MGAGEVTAEELESEGVPFTSSLASFSSWLSGLISAAPAHRAPAWWSTAAPATGKRFSRFHSGAVVVCQVLRSFTRSRVVTRQRPGLCRARPLRSVSKVLDAFHV